MTRYIYIAEWEVFDIAPEEVQCVRFATEDITVPPNTLTLGATATIAGSGRRILYGRIKGFPEFEMSRFEGIRTRGGIGTDAGRIVLDNADGGLDGLLLFPCDGRIARIWALDPETWVTKCLWLGLADGYEVDEETVTVRLAGFQSFLDRSIMPNRFDGSGGLEGSADDLQGKPKPMLLGKVYNVKPPCVNTTKLIYQLDGQMGEFFTGYDIDFYDERSALSDGGTYGSLTDLQDDGLAPGAGEFKLFPGPGGVYIRLGSAPTGDITCDVTNPADYTGYSFPGLSGYKATYSSLCEAQWLLINLLGWLQVNEVGPITSSFPNIAADTTSSWSKVTDPASQDAGIYIDDDATYRDVFTNLLNSFGGALSFSNLANPQASIETLISQAHIGTAHTTYTEDDIVRGSFRVTKPGDPEGGVPPKKVVVKYRQNFTVMSSSQLAGSVSDADVAALAQQWRSVSADGSAFVLGAYLSAPVLEISTALYETAAAENLRDDVLLAIYAQQLFVIQFEIEMERFIEDFLLVYTYPFRTGRGLGVDVERYGADGVGGPILHLQATSKGTMVVTVVPILGLTGLSAGDVEQ